MSNPAIPRLLGCDGDAQSIFELRWEPLHSFLVMHLDAASSWNDLPSSETRVILQERFEQLEQNVLKSRRGRIGWQEDYLLPLAKQLDLVERFRTSALQKCWQRGLFDLSYPANQKLARPEFNVIFIALSATIKQADTSKRQVAVLVHEGLCRDESTARLVVQELTQVYQRAAALARGLVLSAIGYGWIGLLHLSTYACADELLLLQRHIDHIASLSDQPYTTLGILRSDVSGLYFTLHSIQPGLDLWQQHLLHAPPASDIRIHYRERISQEIHSHIVAKLAERLNYSTEDAATVFETFVAGGLASLIDWRCGLIPQMTDQTITLQRIKSAIEQHLGALVSPARQEVVRLLTHLANAVDETKVPLPLIRLLNEYPSSRYRIRLGRRLSFGVGATLRRHKQQKRGQQHLRRKQRVIQQPKEPSSPSPEERLIDAFTRRAGLSSTDNNSEGRTRLRHMLTYGGIGMLPKEQWLELIDSRLVSFLYFFKLGRLDGTLDWPNVLKRLRQYANTLDLAAPSSQLAKAIFNCLPKPSWWHGGQGEAVSTVKQRETLMIDAPRLHNTWIVFVVRPRLRLQVAGNTHQEASNTCEVLVVFDKASERPVGLWVNPAGITADDLCLSLYQSIWHPGALYWPLRGIPENIQIPQSFLDGRRDDMTKVAQWMMSDIQPLTKTEQAKILLKCPYIDDLLRKMPIVAPGYIRRKAGSNQVTPQQSLDLLLGWLHSDEVDACGCFPHHRSSLIPPQCGSQGVLMPALDSPIAGHLLPITDPIVISSRNKVIYRGLTYSLPDFYIEPGISLKVRSFPYVYDRVPPSIFVENGKGELYYLTGQL